MKTQELLNAGWLEKDTNPFSEKVSQGADNYFVYKNKLNSNVGICHFEKDKMVKLRLENPTGNDVRWFQMEYGDQLDSLIDAIIEVQDNLSLDNYFACYSAFSSVCPTSFLAWEQWENNYR